jgi:heme/copper-type cytochrome/quinol oxidase subunit 4
MDFFAATKALEWVGNKREFFVNLPITSTTAPAGDSSNGTMLNLSPSPAKVTSTAGTIIGFVVGLIIGLIAAWLSWTCNTAMDYNIVLKVIFAVFAYIFGFLYIIMYIIMRFDTCYYIQSRPKY